MQREASVRIRDVSAGDRAALCSIIGRCANLSDEEKDCAKELLDVYLDDSGQRDYSFIAATSENDRPKGYACFGKRPLADGVYDLYWIAVDPDERRRGVGKRLIEAVEAAVKARGARMLIAETSGLDANMTVRDFYIRGGFKEEARIKDFHRTGDALVIYARRF